MKSYLLLGRTGDICSILPMLKHESESGPVRLVTNKEYSPLLEGVSYVEPLLVEHTVKDLQAAWQYARATCGEVTSLHAVTNDEPARMTSFVKEMWRRGGWRDQWDDQKPLVFDKRSAERESRLMDEFVPKKKGRWDKKLVLVSTEGISSPFPYKDLLYGILKLGLPSEFVVVPLPRAERFYDLLALYERAWCLISTDSAPLHLANALPKLPVLALTNDAPMLWNGSPWRPNHVFYCRYSDFPNRAVQMVETVKALNDGWPAFEIQKGMCGRYFDGFPYLKDCVKMALQSARRIASDVHLVGGKFVLREPVSDKPCYAYRNEHGLFKPVVDWFHAAQPFWKQVIGDLPDLVLGKDYYWRHALWAAFKKHGAVDVT